MDTNTLIAKQALQIEELKEQLNFYQSASETINNILYCVGGPLNENRLKYTNEQLVAFSNISKELDL